MKIEVNQLDKTIIASITCDSKEEAELLAPAILTILTEPKEERYAGKAVLTNPYLIRKEKT